MSELEAEPTCPRHPRTVAYVTCQRCGRPTCPECQRPAAVGIQCVDCVNEAQRGARTVVSRLGLPVNQGAPVLTYALIGINVAFYIFGQAIWGGEGWLVRFGFAPVVAWDEPWRWITSGFTHSVYSIFHIGLNMFVLWQFGRIVEQLFGRARFLIVYFGSMLTAGVAIMIFSAPGQLHVGASGAIFGLVTAYILAASRLRAPVKFLVLQAGALLIAGFFVSGISWEGHLGGAVGGAAIGAVILTLADRKKRAAN